MPTIPAAMLRPLYQRGSLRNREGGWQFTVRNHLAPATLLGIGVTCDGGALSPAALTVLQPPAQTPAQAPVAGASLSAEAPLAFPVGVETIVRVEGARLAPGMHQLVIRADTREIGPVTITVQDTVGE